MQRSSYTTSLSTSARRSELASRLHQMLSDANDAIEINAPDTALRRIRAALEICKGEILK